MSEAPELKPCPFCGGGVEMNDYTDKPAAAWVMIHRCPVIGPIRLTGFDGAQLAQEWNTRADLSPALSAALAVPEVAALVEAAERHACTCSRLQDECVGGDLSDCGWIIRSAIAALRAVKEAGG